eukprot:CAMPEP_0168568300 /NCGR_PEP_ID=MMETSP0413-20121227/15500_1 /TAXON_ID=136452 /ORGANISM="Filamoeba nolandi, Strain NC-AS-23-1" /LENGTH=361 /DNA_ID=CAMNT_0008600619 /DNA_START=174 /DNA_END=1256 /DNA_ORIENTATION=-
MEKSNKTNHKPLFEVEEHAFVRPFEFSIQASSDLGSLETRLLLEPQRVEEEGEEEPLDHTMCANMFNNTQVSSTVNSNNSNYCTFANTAMLGYENEHSVENYASPFGFSTIKLNKELFLMQRQMLWNMGILSGEYQPFPAMGYSQINLIPTRTIEPSDCRRTYQTDFRAKSIPKRFVIFKQPDSVQRRSYPNEKRFLSPKPIRICRFLSPKPIRICDKASLDSSNRVPLPRIVEGTVSVELAYEAKNQNVDELNYQPHLLKCSNGSTKQILENTAEFELTVLASSGETKFVLVFRVEYKTQDGELTEEVLISSPFEVVANVSKMKSSQAKRHKMPKVQGLVPTEGPANTETEVWIKGSHFS